MAILIDPPTWPAHGTVFSHLVSDASLTELHDFARKNSLSPRAFDLDHYDVPAELFDRLIEAGAEPVTGGELTRRLIRSGLRVPLKERPKKIRGTLLKQWNETLPGNQGLGEHLLDQWEEPHRKYHNSAHLLEMLTALETLYGEHEPPRAVLLAAWLHDIVYEGRPGQDERASAEFARDVLTPLAAKDQDGAALAPAEVRAVARLIELTAEHAGEADRGMKEAGLGAEDIDRFFDADLAILAAKPDRYRRYVRGVRAEYEHVSDEFFRRARAEILEGFLAREQLFKSERARSLWEERARANMRAELERRHGRAAPTGIGAGIKGG